MDNKHDGEWHTATNKKKDKMSPVTITQSDSISTLTVEAATVDKPPPNLNNSFSPLDDEKKEDPQPGASTKGLWGDIQDPEVGDVMAAVTSNLDKCDGFDQRMGFLQESMAAIAESAASMIEEQRRGVNSVNANDRDTVRGLHELAQFGTSFTQSMSDNLLVINTTIQSIEEEKTKILDGWNAFVHGLNKPVKEEEKQPQEQRHILQRPTINSSFLSALDGGRHVAQHGANLITTSIGLVDIRCPASSNPKDVPLLGIHYNPTLSCFVINLDGDTYSFGTGRFTSRKGKNVKGESTLYGKRCNPREMTCNGSSCTYYHDPLKFTTNAHTTRNMAIPYIAEDLIKGIASDQEILANTSYDKNPFIVEDIVQLAGMLLLKAMAVKSVVKSNPSRNKQRRPQRANDNNRR